MPAPLHACTLAWALYCLHALLLSPNLTCSLPYYSLALSHSLTHSLPSLAPSLPPFDSPTNANPSWSSIQDASESTSYEFLLTAVVGCQNWFFEMKPSLLYPPSAENVSLVVTFVTGESQIFSGREFDSRPVIIFRWGEYSFFLAFPLNFGGYDTYFVEIERIKQKGNGFLRLITSGSFITFITSKEFNNFFSSWVDNTLKAQIQASFFHGTPQFGSSSSFGAWVLGYCPSNTINEKCIDAWHMSDHDNQKPCMSVYLLIKEGGILCLVQF